MKTTEIPEKKITQGTDLVSRYILATRKVKDVADAPQTAYRGQRILVGKDYYVFNGKTWQYDVRSPRMIYEALYYGGKNK